MKKSDNNSQGIVSIIHSLCLIIHKLGTRQSVNYSPHRHGGQGIIHNIKGLIISIYRWELCELSGVEALTYDPKEPTSYV